MKMMFYISIAQVSVLIISQISRLICGEISTTSDAIYINQSDFLDVLRCDGQSVIFVTHATYVLWAPSVQCVFTLTDEVIAHCSGRTECRHIQVRTFTEEYSCPKYTNIHLKIDYQCWKVQPLVGNVVSQAGIISSQIQRGEDLHINVKDTHQISLTLYDFMTLYYRGTDSLENCREYAAIWEDVKGKPIHTIVCGAKKMKRIVYHSHSSHIKVSILSRRKYIFILEYAILGCETPSTPADGWHRRHGDVLVFGCAHSDNTWMQTCVGTEWQGKIKTCSDVPTEKTMHQFRNKTQGSVSGGSGGYYRLRYICIGTLASVVFLFTVAGFVLRRIRKSKKTDDSGSVYAVPDEIYYSEPQQIYQPQATLTIHPLPRPVIRPALVYDDTLPHPLPHAVIGPAMVDEDILSHPLPHPVLRPTMVDDDNLSYSLPHPVIGPAMVDDNTLSHPLSHPVMRPAMVDDNTLSHPLPHPVIGLAMVGGDTLSMDDGILSHTQAQNASYLTIY